jgi:hypothetical protein
MTFTRRNFAQSALILPTVVAFPKLTFAQSSATRIALVVGNSAYKDSPLPNAKNDARDIAAALRDLQFDVVTVQDATRTQMLAALEEVGKKLTGKGATALFYFAGHGLQLDWRNYLVPVDAMPQPTCREAVWRLTKCFPLLRAHEQS